jgi:hypothetical protein
MCGAAIWREKAKHVFDALIKGVVHIQSREERA